MWLGVLFGGIFKVDPQVSFLMQIVDELGGATEDLRPVRARVFVMLWVGGPFSIEDDGDGEGQIMLVECALEVETVGGVGRAEEKEVLKCFFLVRAVRAVWGVYQLTSVLDVIDVGMAESKTCTQLGDEALLLTHEVAKAWLELVMNERIARVCGFPLIIEGKMELFLDRAWMMGESDGGLLVLMF